MFFCVTNANWLFSICPAWLLTNFETIGVNFCAGANSSEKFQNSAQVFPGQNMTLTY